MMLVEEILEGGCMEVVAAIETAGREGKRESS